MKASRSVQAMDALVIDDQAFAFKQDVQAPIPVPRESTDAAFVRIAGATMTVSAANGLLASVSIDKMS